jgi:hypothetical protein
MARKRKSYYTDCEKGRYRLMNPGKYMVEGVTEVDYKSSWEKKFFPICDGNEFVTRWGYEPFEIPYSSPVYLKQSLYRTDIYLECRYPDGHEEKWLIEIKPVCYSQVPKVPKPPSPDCRDQAKWEAYRKKQAAYERKSADIATNFAKWQAAEEWCKRHGVNWFIANEKNTRGLFGGKLK